jgi:hypothetical protein
LGSAVSPARTTSTSVLRFDFVSRKSYLSMQK